LKASRKNWKRRAFTDFSMRCIEKRWKAPLSIFLVHAVNCSEAV